mgnify:CR=1 FL=1
MWILQGRPKRRVADSGSHKDNQPGAAALADPNNRGFRPERYVPLVSYRKLVRRHLRDTPEMGKREPPQQNKRRHP